MGRIARGAPASPRVRVTPATIGASDAGARGVAARANATSALPRAPSTTSSHLPSTASLRVAGASGASALGDRAAIPGTEGRTRARPLRRPLVCRLAAPRRVDRARPRVAAGRTPAGRGTRADAARRVGGDHEILTAHFFVTRPQYLRTMQKLAEINLRIYSLDQCLTPKFGDTYSWRGVRTTTQRAYNARWGPRSQGAKRESGVRVCLVGGQGRKPRVLHRAADGEVVEALPVA